MLGLVFAVDFHHRSSGWTFQQDGASVHKSSSTSSWLARNNIRLLNADRWPPMSPDMNPIEHLWPMVMRHLEGQVFSGKDHLWSGLEAAFNAITPDQIWALYDSMPRRMQAVIDARGGPTRY